MNEPILLTGASLAVHVIAQGLLVARILLRPHREPASRVAWVVVVFALPLVGILAYLLVGEVRIGRRQLERTRDALARLPDVNHAPGLEAPRLHAHLPKRYAQLFRLGQSISGYAPIGGNRASLPVDSDAVIDAIVADIDRSHDHVHLLFYIWLPDGNGIKVAEALMRAAARGVTCRAMVDDLGSRAMIGSEHWRAMGAAGVRVARALPIGNPVLRALLGRIDLRNHRKLVVIDDWVSYCGSQNCADPEFFIKAQYGPWVDAMIRFEGPIARQNQHLFASDWMVQVDDDLGELLCRPLPASAPGFPAQVIATGPTVRNSAMPETFEALIYSARRELVITTPYYVAGESTQAALCAAARRGVETLVVFPARNDSWIVAAASRSYYEELLAAGVEIREYVGGLLHTKSLTVDGEVTLIGSANMDRRSFDLNYENNILFYDPDLTAQMRRRQQAYIDSAYPVDPQAVAAWTRRRRLWNNAVAMFGPVL